jgi:carbonic anhydrase
MMPTVFEDLLSANAAYQDHFVLGGLQARAQRGLAVLTCIDSRIEPLAMLGLEPGDAKILRNAGARVTEDVLRSLVLATNFLGVRRIAVVQHTDCAMQMNSNEQFRSRLAESGHDASDWDFLSIDDRSRVLRDDIERIRTCALVPEDTEIGGFVYDVATGALQPAT